MFTCTATFALWRLGFLAIWHPDLLLRTPPLQPLQMEASRRKSKQLQMCSCWRQQAVDRSAIPSGAAWRRAWVTVCTTGADYTTQSKDLLLLIIYYLRDHLNPGEDRHTGARMPRFPRLLVPVFRFCRARSPCKQHQNTHHRRLGFETHSTNLHRQQAAILWRLGDKRSRAKTVLLHGSLTSMLNHRCFAMMNNTE
ncbi:hypothetical protein B0T14DRAFT_9190 [Immersiella caudata]|uniref:Secreted protein n=1 Tax=Immersiella caudata TaxID=314043 RepID=A0AA40CBR6_9PEZI|nr:hypothetical protein B0T14DRAFT_9190 [Immersiella caudata]